MLQKGSDDYERGIRPDSETAGQIFYFVADASSMGPKHPGIISRDSSGSPGH